MSNIILHLIKLITALYYNDKAEDENPSIIEEAENYLKTIKIDPRMGDNLGSETDILEALKYTCEWMVYHKEGNYEKSQIIQRLKINLNNDNDYLGIVTEAINDVSTAEARNISNSIMQELRYDQKKNKLKAIVFNAHKRLNLEKIVSDTNGFVSDLMTELTDVHSTNSGEINGLVGKVDFNDSASIEAALVKGTELSKPEGLLNTGLTGLNDACGGIGIQRGHLVNFGALTHHYKSGILNDLSLNLPVFNDPWMWDNTKRPMILRVSFENTIDQDIIVLYKKLYELKYDKKCDVGSIELTDAIPILKDHFQQRGYTFNMEHYNPANFCVYDLFDLLNGYIDNGFEIHALIVDYLPLIADNTFGDKKDVKIQKSYEMVRNFCYPKGITTFTGCQLSTEAGNLSRENTIGFTRKVCHGGWYQECRSLHTKLDLEIVMHIIQHFDGTSYLSFSRGKHRGGENTAINKRHFFYKFEEFGGIRPDYGQLSRALYSLPSQVENNTVVDWDE